MQVLQTLLGSRWAGPVVVVLAIAAVLLGGTALELNESTKYLIAMLLALAFLGLFAFTQYRASKSASMLESALRDSGAAPGNRPGDAERIADLKKRFDESLALLRQSKLGRGAIYKLPWFVIIGPPGSGKTTMLRESGIEFPYMTKGRAAIAGLGGTKNCDWWFANRGVLLDTAGRFVTEFEDRGEWLEFLKLLKRSRKEQPINGAVVCVSLEDVAYKSETELRKIADDVRDRIGELTQHLKVIFPVSLVFTKCDLLLGFVEFFERFDDKQRKQVWGVTLPFDRPADSDFAARFEQEFDLLADGIARRRLLQLSGDGTRKEKQLVYQLPEQFRAIRQRVCQFVDLLQQANEYREISRIRGCYFTSGTQERSVLSDVMAKMAADFGLDPGELDIPEGERKCYFVDDVFDKVVFAESDLVVPTDAPRRKVVYNASLAAMAVAALLLVGVVWSNYSDAATKAQHVAEYFGNAQDKALAGKDFAAHVKAIEDLQIAVNIGRKRDLPGYKTLELLLAERLHKDVVKPVDDRLRQDADASLAKIQAVPQRLAEGDEVACLRALPEVLAAQVEEMASARAAIAASGRKMRSMRKEDAAAFDEARQDYLSFARGKTADNAELQMRASRLFDLVATVRGGIDSFPTPAMPTVDRGDAFKRRIEALAAALEKMEDKDHLERLFGPIAVDKSVRLLPANLCKASQAPLRVSENSGIPSIYVAAPQANPPTEGQPAPMYRQAYLAAAEQLREQLGAADVGAAQMTLRNAADAAYGRFQRHYEQRQLQAWQAFFGAALLPASPGPMSAAQLCDKVAPLFDEVRELVTDCAVSCGGQLAAAPKLADQELTQALASVAKQTQLGSRANAVRVFVDKTSKNIMDGCEARWRSQVDGRDAWIAPLAALEERLVDRVAAALYDEMRDEVDTLHGDVRMTFQGFAGKFPFDKSAAEEVPSDEFFAWLAKVDGLAGAAEEMLAIKRAPSGVRRAQPGTKSTELVKWAKELSGCFDIENKSLPLWLRLIAGADRCVLQQGRETIYDTKDPSRDSKNAASWSVADAPLTLVATSDRPYHLRDLEKASTSAWTVPAGPEMPKSFWNVFRLARLLPHTDLADADLPPNMEGTPSRAYSLVFKGTQLRVSMWLGVRQQKGAAFLLDELKAFQFEFGAGTFWAP